ncbi:MAG: hypothetical protein ACKVJU_16355 [Verrucomicrobiales bacterium]
MTGFIIRAGILSFQYVKIDDFGIHHKFTAELWGYDPPGKIPSAPNGPFGDSVRPYLPISEECQGSFDIIRESFGFDITVPFWFLTSLAATAGAVCWMVIRHRQKSRNVQTNPIQPLNQRGSFNQSAKTLSKA